MVDFAFIIIMVSVFVHGVDQLLSYSHIFELNDWERKRSEGDFWARAKSFSLISSNYVQSDVYIQLAAAGAAAFTTTTASKLAHFCLLRKAPIIPN